MDCNKQVPKDQKKKNLKFHGNIWALTKIYRGFEFGKHETEPAYSISYNYNIYALEVGPKLQLAHVM